MYNVSVSPHVRAKDTTQKIMRDVAISLIPIIAFSVYQFGWRALLVTAVCVVSCVAFEALYELLAKKPITVFDFSAVVTGLILAVNLPPQIIWWIPVIGSAFAIIVVKMLFGGLGQNFMNPALAARCFLLISFTSRMTDFSVDGVSSATPLAIIRAGGEVNLTDLFIGLHNGCLGEVSIVAVLIGFAYLLIRKVITPHIPCLYVISTFVFIWLIRVIGGNPVSLNFLLAQVLSGGLIVGAVYMATDYTTCPITMKGKVVYGIMLGLLTALFRTLGASAEGVSYAIIIGNLLVPLIEKLTVPKPFGCEKRREANN